MEIQNSKVLLVEDDPFLSNLLKVRLQKENVDVILARDGEEALKRIDEDRPGLVLLDLILPKKSGFEILEKTSTDPQLKDMPIIIISNLGQTSDIQRGKELGAVEYYVKAKISIDDLVGKVKNFLVKK
jgi:DNA-binding response OmpR family regulator